MNNDIFTSISPIYQLVGRSQASCASRTWDKEGKSRPRISVIGVTASRADVEISHRARKFMVITPKKLRVINIYRQCVGRWRDGGP